MNKSEFFITENGNFIRKTEITAIFGKKPDYFIIFHNGKEFPISKTDFSELQEIFT